MLLPGPASRVPGRVVAGIGAVVLLAGCSADEPVPAPPTASATPEAATSSEAPTPTRTPTITPPVPPPEAQEQTREGAAAFARYWFDALEYAYRTGDTAPVDTASSSDCEDCGRHVDDITAQYAHGGSYLGGDITVEEVNVAPMEESAAIVSLSFSEAESRRVDAAGAVEEVFAEDGPRNYLMSLEWSSGAWSVYDIARDGA